MKLLIRLYIVFMLTSLQVVVCAQSNSMATNMANTIIQPVSISAKVVSKRLLYAKSIFNDSLTKSLKIVEDNLAISIQSGYQTEEALAHKILGECNSSLGNYSSAIKNLIKANQIYAYLNDINNSIETYDLLGDSYAKIRDSEQAIKQWVKGEKIASQTKNQTTNTINLGLKIAEEYFKLSNSITAKLYFEKVLSLAKQVNNSAGVISATIGLGKIEEKNGANSAAENLFIEANYKAVNSNSVELTNSSMNSLSNLYRNSRDFRKRKKIQEQAIEFNNSVGNSEIAILNTTEMAEVLIEEGEDEKAIEVLNQSAPLIENQSNSEAKRNFYKTLSRAYEEKGDLKKSKALDKEYSILMDSFKLLEAQKSELLIAKNDIIQNTENKISLLEKDRELDEKTIQLLQKEQIIKDKSLKSQQTIMIFLVVSLLLIGTIILFVYRSNKQKQKNNQLLTLKSLRNQMNPHFIFNSLNSVNVYIAQQDERAANKYLADFSKLMRSVLNYSQNDFIPLSKELEILTLYLNLEHDRFKENFDFSIDCPKSIDLESHQIPPMLLQPIVENAIWHGLRYKPEKGILSLQFLEVNEGLKITVTDNGIGRTHSLKHKTTSQLKMKSTGIKNVKDRLEIIKSAFKKELSIQIDDLIPETQEGTVVTILLKA
ncbi:MAG: histidine kinase [Crocinitomicaceae bacterium]